MTNLYGKTWKKTKMSLEDTKNRAGEKNIKNNYDKEIQFLGKINISVVYKFPTALHICGLETGRITKIDICL